MVKSSRSHSAFHCIALHYDDDDVDDAVVDADESYGVDVDDVALVYNNYDSDDDDDDADDNLPSPYISDLFFNFS